jgi:hypothetical protein
MSKINNRIRMVKGSFAALLFSQAYLLSGCDEPPEYLDDVEDSEDVESVEDNQLRSWTAYTSEETPPIECPNGQALQGVDCTGDYCDNIAIYCETTGRISGWSTWLPYFSEEGTGSANEGHCVSGDMWMTGLNCQGSYCDNLTMRCTQLVGSWTGMCWWSDWYSEEQAPFYASGGTYIKGIECSGGYCDNKRYRYCQLY